MVVAPRSVGTAPWFLCRIAFAGSVPSRTGPDVGGPVSEDARSNLPLSPYVAPKSAAVNGAEILAHWGGVIVYH